MGKKLCGAIHKACSHVDFHCTLPKGHDGNHKTLFSWIKQLSEDKK